MALTKQDHLKLIAQDPSRMEEVQRGHASFKVNFN